MGEALRAARRYESEGVELYTVVYAKTHRVLVSLSLFHPASCRRYESKSLGEPVRRVRLRHISFAHNWLAFRDAGRSCTTHPRTAQRGHGLMH